MRVNKILANSKTMAETGFDFVCSKLDAASPLGLKAQKEARPFYPGEEELLEEELNKLGAMIELTEKSRKTVDRIRETLHCLKDLSRSIERADHDILAVVELFEIKSLLIYSQSLREQLAEIKEVSIPEEFMLPDTSKALDILDPKGDRINTFYIYDDYSERLAELRAGKKELDGAIRKLQKELKNKDELAQEKASENHIEEKIEALIKERDILAIKIEEEEDSVRLDLSKRIGQHKKTLLKTLTKIGRLDYVIAKALFAIKNNLVRPVILNEHEIRIHEGRQLQVESILKSRGKEYIPISMDLEEQVTCITGANMGGKTISLKLAGLIPLMAQYGYYVPCESAEIGLSNYIRILIGDSQSVERGLSSFGSEMEELKEILKQASDRSLLLIDEIASGTNPVEGLALTRSIVEYLLEKPYITLLTTHYEGVTIGGKARNMQVRGLMDANFRQLNSELSTATPSERIGIISKYMDYRLMPVSTDAEIPKDAINIAKILGLPESIINRASEIINNESN